MRYFVGLLVLFCLSFASLAQQQDTPASETSSHYISDDLFIFLHTGPGRQYRIIGSVNAGVPVTKTDKQEANDFVEIIDADGRTGWIEAEFLSDQPSRRLLVTQLREQAADAVAAAAPLRQQLSQLNQDLQSASQENAELTAQLSQATTKVSELQAALQVREQDEQVRWLLTGGALVAGGLLLGVILSFLPKRRKRNDEWIN